MVKRISTGISWEGSFSILEVISLTESKPSRDREEWLTACLHARTVKVVLVRDTAQLSAIQPCISIQFSSNVG
jgi:hypothetical protein